MRAATFFFTSLVILLPAFHANADVSSCEQKHKAALREMITYVRQSPDKELVNLILNGKNSGVKIFAMDDDHRQHLMNDAMPMATHIQWILSKPGCTLTNEKIEFLKSKIKPSSVPELQFMLDKVRDGINALFNPNFWQIPGEDADPEQAVLALNALGGVQGVMDMLDQAIAKQPHGSGEDCDVVDPNAKIPSLDTLQPADDDTDTDVES